MWRLQKKAVWAFNMQNPYIAEVTERYVDKYDDKRATGVDKWRAIGQWYGIEQNMKADVEIASCIGCLDKNGNDRMYIPTRCSVITLSLIYGQFRKPYPSLKRQSCKGQVVDCSAVAGLVRADERS